LLARPGDSRKPYGNCRRRHTGARGNRPAVPAALPMGWHGPEAARPPRAAPGRAPPRPRGTRQRADETPGRGGAPDTGTGGYRRRRRGRHADDRSARRSWSAGPRPGGSELAPVGDRRALRQRGVREPTVALAILAVAAN